MPARRARAEHRRDHSRGAARHHGRRGLTGARGGHARRDGRHRDEHRHDGRLRRRCEPRGCRGRCGHAVHDLLHRADVSRRHADGNDHQSRDQHARGDPVGHGAGDDDHPYRRVRGAIGEGRVQGLSERLVERVEHVGSLEREHGDRAVALDQKRREARHLPLKDALRLFTNASTPSFLSSVAKSR